LAYLEVEMARRIVLAAVSNRALVRDLGQLRQRFVVLAEYPQTILRCDRVAVAHRHHGVHGSTFPPGPAEKLSRPAKQPPGRSYAETMADATNLHPKPLATIRCRDAARVEIGCDGTARCAASLDAALDVRAQRLSPRGRLRPIDLGLLWIAEL